MIDPLYIVVEWLVPLAMIPLVVRRRRPFVAIAWIGAIFAFPWLAAPGYLMFGEFGLKRGSRGHGRLRRAVGLEPARSAGHEPARSAEAHDGGTLVGQRAALDRLQQAGLPTDGMTAGNGVDLLEDGVVIDRLISDIDAACYHIHLLFFHYAPDRTGRRIAEALAAAAERGVTCRVLVDDFKSRKMARELGPFMETRGVTLRRMLRLRPLRRPFRRWDVRNHRKIAVIDGTVGYTGSTNIHDRDHALDDRVWRQISARLTGPAVRELQMLFVEDWYFTTEELLAGESYFPRPATPGVAAVEVVGAGPTYPRAAVQETYIEALGRASVSVVLTTPYFVPDEAAVVALKLAATRGARVQIIVPERSDRRIADLAARSYFQELMDRGIEIFLHPEGLLHAKTMTINGELALLGTANFDRRSFHLNYEVMLVMADRTVAADLHTRQQRYREEARPVDPELWLHRPLLQRMREDLTKLLAPLL